MFCSPALVIFIIKGFIASTWFVFPQGLGGTGSAPPGTAGMGAMVRFVELCLLVSRNHLQKGGKSSNLAVKWRISIGCDFSRWGPAGG